MSVRGTVFRVSIIKGVKEDEVYELVEVFSGGVATLISENGDSVSLNPGEAALIKEKQDGSDARFVKDDEIDEDFWSSSDLNFNIETDEGEGSPILKISYEKLSEGALDMLVEIADEGQQELAVEKEVLEEVKETGHNYKVTQRIEPTCTKDGLVISKCSICNQEMQEVLPKVNHNFVKHSETAPTCKTNGLIIYRCTTCNQQSTQTIPTLSHNYIQSSRKESTCIDTGYITYKCTNCEDTYTNSISKSDHLYKEIEIKNPECEKDGYVVEQCTICDYINTTILTAIGHDLDIGSISPECKNCKQIYQLSSLSIDGQFNFIKVELMSAVPFADYGGYTKSVDAVSINCDLIYSKDFDLGEIDSSSINVSVTLIVIIPVNNQELTLFEVNRDNQKTTVSGDVEETILEWLSKEYIDTILSEFQNKICKHENQTVETITLSNDAISYRRTKYNDSNSTVNVIIDNANIICDYCDKTFLNSITVEASENNTNSELIFYYDDTYTIKDEAKSTIIEYFSGSKYLHKHSTNDMPILNSISYTEVDKSSTENRKSISYLLEFENYNSNDDQCINYSHIMSKVVVMINIIDNEPTYSYQSKVHESYENVLNSYVENTLFKLVSQ